MNSLNPNHPVSMMFTDQWHKVAALMMHKQGVKEIKITEMDLHTFPPGLCITVGEINGEIVLRLVTPEEGARLAREAGGLPS
jgi:hypothetical protein